MARSLRYLFVLLFLGLSRIAFAQSAPGEIDGKIVDDKGEPVIGAIISVSEGGVAKTGTQTDVDGNYVIKPLDPGRYDVTAKGLTYVDNTITGVIVSPDKTTGLNFKLSTKTSELNVVKITAYKVPLVDKYSNQTILTSDQIEKLPTRSTNDFIALSPGIYQSTAGGGISAQGGRFNANEYIIDGVVVMGGGAIDLPANSIDQIEVNTSGVSAKYGDALGAIPVITTKGSSPVLAGDFLLQHSIDGFNNNEISFLLSGPLYRRKNADGTKQSIIGFNISGDFHYDKDRNPSYIGLYQVKPDALAAMSQNPLTISTGQSGNQIYRYSSEYVTPDQVNHLKTYPNARTMEGRLNGKLDFHLGTGLSLVAGGNFNYTNQQDGNSTTDFFDPSSAPTSISYSGTGFLRFSQRFGKATGAGEKPSTISNAYYQLQADYQITSGGYQDPRFKHNIFDYGYIGKFDQKYLPVYNSTGTDSASGLRGVTYQGLAYNGIDFQRSELNPILANYTSEYFNTAQVAPTSELDIRAHNALLNGDYPASAYNLYPNVGANLPGYYNYLYNQYSFSADASFDLLIGKTRHAIEFGLYYQQRVERSYTLNAEYGSTISIWQQMRSLVNNQLVLDTKNPVFVINGKQYTLTQVQKGLANPGPADTILYNYTTVAGAQSYFDYNLRKKLGLNPNGTDLLNVDDLDPNTFSLNMFNADELLNSGNSYVQYSGYSYLGDIQRGQVNFNDFFTQKDANGQYTRPIAPFSPNYTAGYILDKFQFKDINFNIGLRIDRYDDGEEVLDDPYSLYPEETVGEVSGTLNSFNKGRHPSNIGSNYVVYVDNSSATTPNIIGYRNGDTWYDPTGKVVQDPSVLKAYSGGVDPQPYLKNPNEKIQDSTFDPTKSFKNYTPQVNVQPRLQFSFPVSDVALLYGHYDVYVQRPTDGVAANPLQYYFIQQDANSIIANPDLRPAKMFDYEVGFKQKLTDESAITISAFYKERKDMIQIRPYLYAWPTTYYTFGNRDFSTTKGMTLKYDLRRINHLSMEISYTLQFADGTGSDAYSTNGQATTQIQSYGLLQNLISAGLPNLRYTTDLNYDSRHNIVANLDYRYDQGEGPIVGSSHILENAGINLLFKTRSGEPYTRLLDPVSNQIDGAVNGAHLPWHYQLDLKVDKQFALNFSKKHNVEAGIKPKRPIYADVFLYVNNVLNTQDILQVYGFTGRANDNGYLTSPQGQALIPNQTNPQSYVYLYQLAYNNPGFYNLPRMMNLGVQFNF